MTRRPPALAGFSIFDTCRDGLRLVVAHRALLFRLAVPALAVVLVTAVILGQIPNLTPLRIFFCTLPGLALTAWYLGAASRLWVLGETPNNIIEAPAERRRLLQASVLIYILWKAAVALYEHLFMMIAGPLASMASPEKLQQDPGGQFLLMALLGILFWAVRFRLLPVLAAVGYPLKTFVIRANSFMLSFRTLGLVLVCVELPRTLIITTLLASTDNATVLIVVRQLVTVALETWLFATFVVALRQMLGGKPA